MSIEVFYHFMSGHIIPLPLQEVFTSIAYNKQHTISQLKNREDKYRSLCGLYLLKLGMERFNLPADCWQSITYKPRHKPISVYPINFSITHSHDLIMCAISQSNQLGLDSEYLPINKSSNVPQKVMCNKTNTVIDWVAKEAIVKAQENSGLKDIKQVQLFSEHGLFRDRVWHIHALDLHFNYISRLATNQSNPKIHLNHISII